MPANLMDLATQFYTPPSREDSLFWKYVYRSSCDGKQLFITNEQVLGAEIDHIYDVTSVVDKDATGAYLYDNGPEPRAEQRIPNMFYTDKFVTREDLDREYSNPEANNLTGYNDRLLFDAILNASTVFIECRLPADCRNLMEVFQEMEVAVFLPDCNYHRVKTMEDMFRNSRVSVVVMSGIDAPNLESTKGMFRYCPKLLNPVQMDSWNTPKLKDVSGMFAGCGSLCSITSFPRYHAITNAREMYESSGVEEVNFRVDSNTIQYMQYMFNSCKRLKSVSLVLDAPKLETVNYMFKGCSMLEKVSRLYINAPVLTSTYAMFCDCTALSKLSNVKLSTPKVTEYGQMFDNTALLELDLRDWNPSVIVKASRLGVSDKCKVTLPKTNEIVYEREKYRLDAIEYLAHGAPLEQVIDYEEGESISTDIPFLTAKKAKINLNGLNLGKEEWLYRMSYQVFGHTDAVALATPFQEYDQIFAASSDYNKFIGLFNDHYTPGFVVEMWESIFWPGAYNQSHSDLRAAVGCCVFGATDKKIDIITTQYHLTIDVNKITKGFNMEVGKFLAKLYGVTIAE